VGWNHFGLQGVRERVDKLGGALQIDSRRGQGTMLTVTIPTSSRALPDARIGLTAAGFPLPAANDRAGR
jgi:chemotaxis protein histidine kinase CheA